VSQPRSPRHRPLSAADRDGRQDVLDLGARVVRGAAPTGHHARSPRRLHLDRRAAHRTRRAAAAARARRESEFLRHAGRQSGALPEADIFLPNRWPGDTGRNAFLWLPGRMKQGVTQARAEAELTALVNDSSTAPAGALAPAGAFAPNVRTLARAVGLQEDGTESVRTLLLILVGAVSFVLLIACVNVANLQMARLTARRGELSVRMALGARRRRIGRQLLTEAVVLSLLGASLGVLLAQIAIAVTLPLVPQFALPR